MTLPLLLSLACAALSVFAFGAICYSACSRCHWCGSYHTNQDEERDCALNRSHKPNFME